MKKLVKVYLRSFYHGEISVTDSNGQKALLKVRSHVHPETGEIMAAYVYATLEQKKALWEMEFACSEKSSYALLASQDAFGNHPDHYDDPVPELHKIPRDAVIVPDLDDIEEEAEEEVIVEDDFDLDEEDLIVPEKTEPLPNVMGKAKDPNPKIEDLISLSRPIKARLEKAKLIRFNDIAQKTVEDLEAINGIGHTTATKLVDAAKNFQSK